MAIIRTYTRPAVVHPPWCDVPRCMGGLNGSLGEHRSTPLSLPGLPVVTLMQRPGGPVYAEVRRRVRLVDAGDGGQAHAARLAVAVSRAIDASMDESGYCDHDATGGFRHA